MAAVADNDAGDFDPNLSEFINVPIGLLRESSVKHLGTVPTAERSQAHEQIYPWREEQQDKAERPSSTHVSSSAVFTSVVAKNGELGPEYMIDPAKKFHSPRADALQQVCALMRACGPFFSLANASHRS